MRTSRDHFTVDFNGKPSTHVEAGKEVGNTAAAGDGLDLAVDDDWDVQAGTPV